MIRRMLVAATTAVATTVLLVGSAAATIPPPTIPPQGTVGPHQYFDGLVNAKTGLGAPVTIRMACFGAIRPGQTGHPMAGQTVEVLRPLVIVVGHTGYTGANANSIVAFFGPPPPTPLVTPPTASAITFRRYGVAKAIPTSIVLPCSGTGNVTFVPLPMSPPTPRAATVPVSYVGQP